MTYFKPKLLTSLIQIPNWQNPTITVEPVKLWPYKSTLSNLEKILLYAIYAIYIILTIFFFLGRSHILFSKTEPRFIATQKFQYLLNVMLRKNLDFLSFSVSCIFSTERFIIFYEFIVRQYDTIFRKFYRHQNRFKYFK